MVLTESQALVAIMSIPLNLAQKINTNSPMKIIVQVPDV